MAISLWGDTRGTTLIEFTAVFFALMLVVFGTVDASLLMFTWGEGNKATYAGARFAVINNPVAGGITNPTGGSKAGLPCYNADGSVNATANCTTVNTVCTGATAGGTCTNGFAFQNAAFTAIFNEMQRFFSSRTLDRRQIQISYQTTGLGYVKRPGGSPMNVTVSLRCMTHQFYFLSPLLGWVFPALPAECQGVPTPGGITLPTFSTTLPSEDLTTNG